MDHSTSPTPPSELGIPVRRGFFRGLVYGLSAVAAAAVAVPFVGYLFGSRKGRAEWLSLGPVDQFPRGQTKLVTFDNPLRQPWDGIVGQVGVYVRFEGKDEGGKDRFLVLSTNCAHLGCAVSWFPESELFMCPCHGGVYYADGRRASGPPPHGMFLCDWRVRGGRLEIRPPDFPTVNDPHVRG
jgi:Rieske Fe-S protein